MVLQHLASDPNIGASGELQPAQVIIDAMRVAQGRAQRSFACAGRMRQRPIDVPKEKSFHEKRAVSRRDGTVASLGLSYLLLL
jgi:hypothetical protein